MDDVLMLLNKSYQTNDNIPNTPYKPGKDFKITLFDRIKSSFPEMTDDHAADEDRPSAFKNTRRCYSSNIAGFADTSEPSSKSDVVAWTVGVVL